MRISTAINAHKALVPLVVAGMMAWYGNGSATAFVYLALHGSYAGLWLVKHHTYRDRRFEEELPWLVALFFVFVPLLAYFVAPWMVIARHLQPPPWLLGFAVFLHSVGMFLHYVSDAQKYYTLKVRPGLIEEGLFSRIRNPNYLGEVFIYSTYALLAMHWLPWLVLAGWWTSFAFNMHRKDRSLARHPGFADYKRRTGWLLPRFRRG
jgi:protein-S-isoprenylcysteine O-methyltransferase Ste14